MNRTGPCKRGWGDFRKPKGFYLSGPDKTSERLAHLLDGCGRITAMNVIEIDDIDTKAGKCLVEFGLKIGRAVVEIALTQLLPAGNARLRGNRKQLIAAVSLIREKSAYDGLGGSHSIDIGGVDMGHALIKRRAQNGMRLRLISCPVEIAE